MGKLLIAVYLALLICPFVGIILTIPYVIHVYNEKKIINVMKCAEVYLMIVFTLAAYFMTMLPFPSFEAVAKMTTQWVQLIPFYCFYDFYMNSGIVISDWTTVIPAFGSGIMLGIVFNVLMLLPSGFLLGRLLRPKKRHILLMGLLISLIFELTQLSGLFFIYERPYRMFDVDDLIQNTFGFFLGAEIAKHCDFLLTREFNITVRQGGEVSFRRRFIADVIDQSILYIIVIVTVVVTKVKIDFFRHHPLKAFPFYFALIIFLNGVLGIITYITNGKTLGMRLRALQLKDVYGRKLRLTQCIWRDLLKAVYLNLPLLILWFVILSRNRRMLYSIIFTTMSAGLVFAYVWLNLLLVLHIITHGEKLIYEKLTWTHLGLAFDRAIRDRQKLIYRGRLTSEDIAAGIARAYKVMEYRGFEEKRCLKMQYLAEAALVQWMDKGLYGNTFTFQIDKRFSRTTLLVCVPGRYTPLENDDESMLVIMEKHGEKILFDTYYTGGLNVLAVEV